MTGELSFPHSRCVTEHFMLQGELIIVGDIHGCHNEMVTLLKRCGYRVGNKEDRNRFTVVLAGDLVNKVLEGMVPPHKAPSLSHRSRVSSLFGCSMAQSPPCVYGSLRCLRLFLHPDRLPLA